MGEKTHTRGHRFPRQSSDGCTPKQKPETRKHIPANRPWRGHQQRNRRRRRQAGTPTEPTQTRLTSVEGMSGASATTSSTFASTSAATSLTAGASGAVASTAGISTAGVSTAGAATCLHKWWVIPPRARKEGRVTETIQTYVVKTNQHHFRRIKCWHLWRTHRDRVPGRAHR